MPSLTRWLTGAGAEPAKEALVTVEGGVAAEAARQQALQTRQRGSFHTKLIIFLREQTTYSQMFKLIVLFVIAIVHAFYASEFLNVFREMESYITFAQSRSSEPTEIARSNFVLELLVDYKKNLWITVSAMCACLSASCFFLLLISEDAYRSIYLLTMRVMDALVFLAMPCLLFQRSLIVKAINTHAQAALIEASKQANPTRMMNALRCSVTLRDNVPLCSTLIERSLFPVVLLEYLVILCIITAAYVGLAYAIVYCIKHWFPHMKKEDTKGLCKDCRCKCRCGTASPINRPLVAPTYTPLPVA